jgi:hypothetical protein
MTRQVRLSVALPLLLALFYRAAIPVGFMPMIGADGHLTVELCTGVAGGARATGHEHHAHHDHQHGDADGRGGSHSLCPFAATAGASPLSSKMLLPAVAPAQSSSAAPEPDSISPPTILRSQQSRAPPSRAFA